MTEKCNHREFKVEAINSRFDLWECTGCFMLMQRNKEGGYIELNELLARSWAGDDRVRSATSPTQVNTIRSFIDTFDAATRLADLQIAEARGGLRVILSQIENRVDFALSKLTGLDLAGGEWGDILEALREARNLVSVLPSRSRGVPKKVEDASSSD